MKSALSHIRVLDLSRILAGPWASQVLADLGAEVIKVEKPGAGDDTRSWGPPYARDELGRDTSESAYFLSANRGKKSIAIDLSQPAGQNLVRELVRNCDVVLENFKAGGLARYGLDYESLKLINPALVYCSITGFGQTGPLSQRSGYDFAIQAMGGLMSITGERDDRPGGGPQKVGVALTDITTGLYAAIAILAAITSRYQTGKGQYIDLALLDVQTAVLANQAMNYLTSGSVPARLGNEHPNIVPYQSFATADGHLVLAVGNDSQFTRFCQLAGLQDCAADPAFQTNAARVQNRKRLIPLIAKVMQTNTTDNWLRQLESEAIPCAPINTIDKVFAHEQVLQRGMKITMEHPLAGKLDMVGNPIHFSDTPAVYERPPPLLGEHTREVLRALLHLDEVEIDRLQREGVIQ